MANADFESLLLVQPCGHDRARSGPTLAITSASTTNGRQAGAHGASLRLNARIDGVLSPSGALSARPLQAPGRAAGQGSMLAVLDPSRDLLEIRMQELMARERLSIVWARVRRETGE